MRDVVAPAGHGRQRIRVSPDPGSLSYRGGNSMRKGILALVCALAGTLLFAVGASAARQATVSASKSVAKACHTKYFGKTSHTGVLRARSGATGLVRARLKSRGDWDVGVFDARTKRSVAGLVRVPRQRARRGLRAQGPAPAGPGLPLRRPGLDRARVRVVHPRGEAQGRRQDADRRRVHADARRQASPPDARPRPDRARRRRLDRGRAVRQARIRTSCAPPSSSGRCGSRTSTSASSKTAGPTGATPPPRRVAARCRAAARPTGISPTTSSS